MNIQTLIRIRNSSGLLYISRKTKNKKENKAITSLKSDTGLSLTSTRGKLEVLQKHYIISTLSRSVDSVFDAG